MRRGRDGIRDVVFVPTTWMIPACVIGMAVGAILPPFLSLVVRATIGGLALMAFAHAAHDSGHLDERGAEVQIRSMTNVIVDSNGVRRSLGDGQEEAITWASLDAVVIVTTDQGPYLEDVFLRPPRRRSRRPRSPTRSRAKSG